MVFRHIFLGNTAIKITPKLRHKDLFSHYNLILRTFYEKFPRKARLNTERGYRIVPMPHGHPIMVLKSN